MSDRPSKAWVEKFVKAAALNKLANGRASIPIQQRMYDRFMKLRDEGMRKWPLVDFDAGLQDAADKWIREHPMAGPGSSW